MQLFLFHQKKDIHLGKVTVKGSDWNGVMEAAKRAFVVRLSYDSMYIFHRQLFYYFVIVVMIESH